MENKWRSIVDQRRWDADWNTSRVGFSWRERQFALLHIVEMGGKVKSESESCSVMSDSLRPHGLYSPRNSPGQNTGVDSCCLLQGIFPTQGLNPGLPHCRQILYQLSHQRSLVYIWGLTEKRCTLKGFNWRELNVWTLERYTGTCGIRMFTTPRSKVVTVRIM